MATVEQVAGLRRNEPRGRWVLFVAVLGSGMVFLDGTVVHVALPAIGSDLGADLAGLQWTVNAYTLTLAACILLGGAAGDRFGRRRVFVIGVVWFAAASLACGLAPGIEVLIAARAVQGIGAALLTPVSLALLQASFREADRGRVIGTWSGLTGIASAVGPVLGGWMVDSASWRLAFLVNVPLAALVVLVALRQVPESFDPQAPRGFDVLGAALGALALGATTYGLVAWGAAGAIGTAWVPLLLGAAATVAFVQVERSSSHPMLPTGIFGSSLFRAVNFVTMAVYAAYSGMWFMLVITLQLLAGFSPTAAGAAVLPVTGLLLVLSGPAGDVGQRTGPRLPLVLGSLLCAAGTLLLLGVDSTTSYLTEVLPGVTLFGLGLAVIVAPLTATVLAAVPQRHAGLASGINNAAARTAMLLIVAALPGAVGLSSDAFGDPSALQTGYVRAMVVCAAVLVVGAVLAAVLITSAPAPEAAPGEPAVVPVNPCRVNCAVTGPPLLPEQDSQMR